MLPEIPVRVVDHPLRRLWLSRWTVSPSFDGLFIVCTGTRGGGREWIINVDSERVCTAMTIVDLSGPNRTCLVFMFVG